MDCVKIKKLGTRLWVTAIVMIFMIFFGCKAEGPILIGFLAGTSGRVADSGLSGRDAAQLSRSTCPDLRGKS